MEYKSNKVMEELMSPIIEKIEQMIVDKKILEIACGTGNWTQVLAKRAACVIASDISPSALAIAQSKLSGYQNISIMQDDAYNLVNIQDSFDVLFSADWWSHIPKSFLPAFLDTSLSKLRPGSNAIFIDMTISEYFRQEPCHYDKDNNRISLRRLPDGSEFQVVKNFPSKLELTQILTNYGEVVAYYEFSTLKRWMVFLRKT
jgi:demethylmenaquinone methyltransferase/2-methoxy-6-polyprenyl-1,4-benzoquinol methylase